MELTLHHPPPFTLATALHRLQPAQGRESTVPTSWRARHCIVFVQRTRPNAVDRLGCTTYRATLRFDLLIHMSPFTLSLVATLELMLHHPLPLRW